MRQAQDTEPDDPYTQALRRTYNELEAQRRATLAAIVELDTPNDAAPARPTADDATLLDALPRITLNLTTAPENLLRALFETTNLTIRLHDGSDQVTISIRLPADDLPHITHTAERITTTMTATQQTPAQTAGTACADAVRAPGRIRTCAPASGAPPPPRSTATTSTYSTPVASAVTQTSLANGCFMPGPMPRR
jgi:site-specific DNA recombinase